MSPQKHWELPHYIHDIGRDESLVTLCLTLLAQVQKLLDYVAEELVLILLLHTS